MTQLRSFLKAILPRSIRGAARKIHRAIVFRRAMGRFLHAPADCAVEGHPVLLDLIYGWGNEVWSAQDEYLVASVRHALSADGPFLECGSGLSTILVGAVAQRRGTGHWALEHTAPWAEKVQLHLDRYQINSVMLCAAPLKDYGDCSWYDPPLESMPDKFGLVICDGPPASTPGGRVGLVTVLGRRLAPGCVILLDDAAREQELAVAERWQQELGSTCAKLGTKKPYLEIRVPNKQAAGVA
jgi:hypothetical protein